MDPGNLQYRQTLNQVQQSGQGYRPYGHGGVDGLDVCSMLLCANCLCGGGRC